MSAFDIVYDGLAEAIVTNAIVMSDNNIGSDKTFPPYFSQTLQRGILEPNLQLYHKELWIGCI